MKGETLVCVTRHSRSGSASRRRPTSPPSRPPPLASRRLRRARRFRFTPYNARCGPAAAGVGHVPAWGYGRSGGWDAAEGGGDGRRVYWMDLRRPVGDRMERRGEVQPPKFSLLFLLCLQIYIESTYCFCDLHSVSILELPLEILG